jgi:hypothetical protein
VGSQFGFSPGAVSIIDLASRSGSLGRLGWVIVIRHALVGQMALVSRVIHQDTAFLTEGAKRRRLRDGYFVFCPAFAFMRSGEPFDKFGHAWNMRRARLILKDLGQSPAAERQGSVGKRG